MFVANDRHLQISMFGSIDSLPEKIRKRLEASWAGTFYDQVFVRVDESRFAVLYSDEPSRPNTPVNVLMGLEILKSGFGWSDEEMYDHFCYDVQVRYALGYRDLGEGHFELRTMYNFRQRLSQHMQETGENLFEQVFEQITDEQLAAFELKTDKLRMDSTLIASNIREMSRLQLLVEVLQRVHRMLSEEDQAQYAEAFAPYLKGSSGQYIYRLKAGDVAGHLQGIGELMAQLTGQLAARYGDEPAYQVLQRVFQEHFHVDEAALRPKAGDELKARSLQSPDDWEATYRQKRGQEHKGYVANLTETCHPENGLQLIVKVQTKPNNTDDAVMLNETLPELKERTDVDEMHTDGGYNSPDVDEMMRTLGIEQVQTAIRGRQPSAEKLNLDAFVWDLDDEGRPQAVACPNGQQAEVTPGRKGNRYRAAFATPNCESCPFLKACRTEALACTPEQVLRFSQQDVDLALRRQRSAEARATGQNLRPAVEATVRSVKHPFDDGKVPVRGQPRVSIVVLASAAMSNLRRIHRFLVEKSAQEAEKGSQREAKTDTGESGSSLLGSLRRRVQVRLRLFTLAEPAWIPGIH
jgi:hypothetical protein